MPSFKQMDLDAYSAAHREEWQRLAQLGDKRSFSGAEADELIERYQAGATHLSAIKTTAGQSVQGDRLSLALGRARQRFTGASANALSKLPVFFSHQLPAALYRVRWLSLAATFAFVAIGAMYAVWIAQNPALLLNFGSEQELRRYAEEEFVGYYGEYSEGGFAAQVWTNNAWIAAQTIAFGVTGLWAPYIIFMNAQAVGGAAAIMNEYDRLDVFFLNIAPHGQLELYAIFVSAAAGMLISWAWIAPGGRTRTEALAEDGRAFFIDRDRPHHRAGGFGHHRGLHHPAGLAVGDQDRHRHGRARRIPVLPVGCRPQGVPCGGDRRPRRVRGRREADHRFLSDLRRCDSGMSLCATKSSEMASPSGSDSRAAYS